MMARINEQSDFCIFRFGRFRNPAACLLFELIDSHSNQDGVFPSAKALNVTVKAPRNAEETKTSEH
jgi:hypothetical protein